MKSISPVYTDGSTVPIVNEPPGSEASGAGLSISLMIAGECGLSREQRKRGKRDGSP